MRTRIYAWLDERLGLSSAILPILRLPVPRDVNWGYVFGSATLVAFVLQVVTGVALAFTYVPAPNSAYDSLQFITHHAVLGRVVRGIHYFGASAMVVLAVVHAARVFLTGSFKYPRELTWLTGVLLLVLTFGMALTGQLLRWNQNAYWSVVVAAEQAARTPIIGPILAQIVIAGQTVGGATLTRFYATHVFLLPALIFALIVAHLYLVVWHGLSEPPRIGQPVERAAYKRRYQEILERGIPFWPDAAWKHVLFALAVGSAVLLLAAAVGPPELGKQADPTVIEADPRPDWYFMWYFALLSLVPPAWEDVVLIGLPLLVLVVLLAMPFVAGTGERSPGRRPWAVATVGLSVLVVGLLTREGYLASWSPVVDPGPLPAGVVQGLGGSAAEGAALFQKKGCQSCHSIAGSGGRYGPDLTAVGDRLSRDQLIIRLFNGTRGMPNYASNIEPAEVTALVDFLAQRRTR